MMFRILLPIILVMFTLIPAYPSLTMDERGLMVGYTGTSPLPFLENGTLEFQLGERLWARAVGGEVEVILRSPGGLEDIHRLRPGELTLLKTFSEESDVGVWTLEVVDDGLMYLVVRDPGKAPLYVRYRIGEKYFSAQLDGPPDAVFIGVEDAGRYLLIAGEDNWLNLSALLGEQLGASLRGEVMVDILSDGSIIYEGSLGGSAYRLELEPLMARVVARIEGQFLHMSLPAMHDPNAGGVIPLRPGSAILRIWLNETYTISRPAYVLDGRFIGFVKMPVRRIVLIPLSDALNQSMKIVRANGGRVEVLELTPPLALLRIQDQGGGPVTNISIASSIPASVIDNTAYMLLRRDESIPVPPSSPLKVPITVYVNGFEAGSSIISLISGRAYNLTISLRRLIVEITSQDGELPRELELRINGTTFKHENGVCSYLLPPGRYVIEAMAPGLRGSASVNLSEDSRVRIMLKKAVLLEDVLKISAIVESACILVLTYISYGHRRSAR